MLKHMINLVADLTKLNSKMHKIKSPKTQNLKHFYEKTHLAFDQCIKEVVVQFPVAGCHEVPQDGAAVVLVEPKAGQVAQAGALVVQPAALGAGEEVEKLICVRGDHGSGESCAGGRKQVSSEISSFPRYVLHTNTFV